MTRSFFFLIAATAVSLLAQPGNGAPSGSHYNLNIIGVEKSKTADMTNSSRHTIFVALGDNGYVKTRINLSEGDYAVLDGNGTDGTAAFQLPDPGYNCPSDPTDSCWNDPQVYTVWVRALGKPGGKATVTTCQDDGSGSEDAIVCSLDVSVTVERTKGKQTFQNVTKTLTTLCLDTDNTPGCDTRTHLFQDPNRQYFWDYDNNGLRLMQMRFYPVPQ